MFKIEIKGIEELHAAVDDLIKHRIPKMTDIGINKLGKGLKEATIKQLSVVFHKPTAWTTNSVYFKPAAASDPNAHVWFKDEAHKGTPASKYLWPEVHGGPRRLKRYEAAMQRFGVLPHGWYTVPGKGVKLDRHGNIPTGTITEILTGIGALEGMSGAKFGGVVGGYKRRKKTTANYFVVKWEKRGGLAPGVWERLPEIGRRIRGYKSLDAKQKGRTKGDHYYRGIGLVKQSVIKGRAVRPILIFVKGAPQYNVRFPFYDWAQRHVDVEFPKIFNRLAEETLVYWKRR